MPRLRANEIYNDPGQLLIAIESVDYSHDKTRSSCRLYAQIEPIAVVVCGANGVYATDMSGEVTGIDQFRDSVPELGAMIEAFDRR